MSERASGATDDRPVEETPAIDEPPATNGDEAPEVKGLERRRDFGSYLRSPWLPWVIAVLFLAFGVFALLERSQAVQQREDATAELAQLREAEKDRAEVSAQANLVALRLTTFEGENIEEWYAQIRGTATGDFATQLAAVFDQQMRDSIREVGVVSRGEMQNLFVQDIDGDQAKAFAVVKMTYVNSQTRAPVEDHQRMDITLERVDGKWLASEVVVLGPNGVIAPTGQSDLPDLPNAGGDQ